MIFFTRQLYQGIQPKSGWERRADREWVRRLEAYCRYEDVIKPYLPSRVAQFLRKSFHDAVVESVKQSSNNVILNLDARPCATGSCHGHRVRLSFKHIHRPIKTSGLVGQWWLHDEVHLCSRAKFSLHVLFTKSELEIDADDLIIEKL
jgi:hypothetical protein